MSFYILRHILNSEIGNQKKNPEMVLITGSHSAHYREERGGGFVPHLIYFGEMRVSGNMSKSACVYSHSPLQSFL